MNSPARGRGRGRSIQRAPHLRFMQRWRSPQAMKRVRERVHDLTDARRSGVKDVKEVIASVNPVIRGWGNYFRTGNAEREFNRIDEYVYDRLVRWRERRGGQRARDRGNGWPRERLHGEMGLHRLGGTGG